MTIPTQFKEVPVPPEFRHIIVRSFRPKDGRDFRLIMRPNGQWSVFPGRNLTRADYLGLRIVSCYVQGEWRWL